MQITSKSDVEEIWSSFRSSILEVTSDICGTSKNHQWRPETWWWNDRIDDAIQEKRIRHKHCKKTKKAWPTRGSVFKGRL